jgi:glucose-1-phosphate adenylyltransferase
MGVYIFKAEVLVEEVIKDAKNKTSKHDFGGDIIPQMVGRKKVYAYNFQNQVSNTPRYWRDIGLLDAYFKAHQDLLGAPPSSYSIRNGLCAPGPSSCRPANLLPGASR